ncbi:MAG TPA: hypothetical protein VH969_24165 [Actinophytocola sp.]|jgi:hypothetical protein|uniref:hypothetical protein n=1 Tax=Actinophytocola sp. TaxID=1872138 RepID=UPI002F924BA2
MTGDDTHVETDELRTWGRGARDRADRMNQVATDASAINLDIDALGLIHRAYCGDLQTHVQALIGKLRGTARHLEIDSTDADAVASSFDDVDQAQADRLTKGGGRG